MPAMNQADAEAAVSQTKEQLDAELEATFFGPGDDITSALDDAMIPPENPEGTEGEESDILSDLSDIEKSMSGKDEEDATTSRVTPQSDEEEDNEDEEQLEDEEPEQAEDGDDEDAEGDDEGDEETLVVSKAAMQELYGKYDAALKAAAGQAPAPEEGAEPAAEEAPAATAEEEAQSYAQALSEAVQPVLLTEEQSEKFGIQDHEGFNEFFSEVQKGLAAQSMAQMAGQLPQLIINQTSQALPFLMAAHAFVEDNPEWAEHTAIVEAALTESKKANPNASARQLVADMEKRINISAKKGEALAGKKRPAKKHDARPKKGQFKGNRTARSTGGKKGKRIVGTEDALRSMLGGSVEGSENDDLAML